MSMKRSALFTIAALLFAVAISLFVSGPPEQAQTAQAQQQRIKQDAQGRVKIVSDSGDAIDYFENTNLIYDEQRQIFRLDYDYINKLPQELHPAYNRTVQLPDFVYDEGNDRFIHRKSGLWYIIKNGRRVFPAEYYIEPGKHEIAYVEMENRPDDVWVHASTTEIVVQPGDSLVWIGTALPQQYRMSMSFWLAERGRFLERNGIKNPDMISPGQVLIYHNYVDREAPAAISEYVSSFAGRFYVGRDRFGYAQLVRIE
jgi:nucleoid-associated protein YgaU